MSVSDQDIIQAVQANPDKGFRLLLSCYEKKIYWHVRRIVVAHQDAEDVTQEVFIRIFRSWSNFRGDSLLSTWIYRIATNESLRFLNQKENQQVSLDDVTGNGFDIMADEFVDYSDLEAVRLQQAIHSLPTKQQLTFNLRYYDDLSYEDIAQVTETNPSTARVNYHVAKEKIIQYMNQNTLNNETAI